VFQWHRGCQPCSRGPWRSMDASNDPGRCRDRRVAPLESKAALNDQHLLSRTPMTEQPVDKGRRTWVAVACGAGAVGGVAAAVPFVSSFQPSERARAAGAPVEVDLSSIQPGQKLTVEWRGKPVWILKRTPEQLKTLGDHDAELADPKSERHPDELTPPYARNEYRSIKPEVLVV